MKRLAVLLMSAVLLILAPAAGGSVSTFDDTTLASESCWNGGDDGIDYGTYSGFKSGNSYFVNYEYEGWDYWDGFAYSSTTDTKTPEADNQISAITGAAMLFIFTLFCIIGVGMKLKK